ncbi:small-subunit processome [Scheffersomyces amazonensis]|uniref:small-subunit processome n=1 Tax=Scheffersomyces amazonensis TaxID=1078765 RepID=UPI00315CA2F0
MRNGQGYEESSEDEDDGYSSIDENQLVTLSEAWDMDDKDLNTYEKSTSKNNDIVLNEDDDKWESESEPESESEEDDDEDDDNSDQEDDSEEDIFQNDSDDIEDEDDINLASTVSKLQSSLRKPEKERRKLIAETTEENEFNLPTNGNKLSLTDMLAAVDSSISKDAILIDEDSKAIAAPLPKRIQQRHDRAVAYEMTKEEISKWEDTVQKNRQAEVLKFPLNPKIKHNDSATTFKSDNIPTTELETKINNVLKESALIDEKKEATFEEIAIAKMSSEEMQRRTNELRLMRELMFRDEKRAKRIKKIKSKQYHKIKKKERLRNQELVEGSDNESEGEDHDMKRAQERMSLKHKTQSNWAKSMIKSGLSKDASNRSELEEMLRQGERLRAKQLGHEDGEQSDDNISDIENDYNRDRDNNEADEAIKNKLGKGVLAMDFMKKAEERSKQENLQELEELRRLEQEGDLQSFEDSTSNVNITINQGRRVYTPSASAIREDIDQVNQQVLAEINDDQANSLTSKLGKKFNVVANSERKDKTELSKDIIVEEDVNPWLTESSEPSQKSNKVTTIDKESSKLSKAAAKIAKKVSKKHNNNNNKRKNDEDQLIDIEETLKVITTSRGGEEDEEEEEGEGIGSNENKMFKQKDLIKEAFAGDDVVEEFEIEKKRTIRDEDDKQEDLTLPGWGDWAGGSKKNKKRKVIKKIDGVVQKDKRKDKNLKNVIINEKVNKKNLKYQSSGVPFPFESREQYERSLRMPVGQEWTSRDTHQKMTMPRIVTKQGTVIDPLKAPFK